MGFTAKERETAQRVADQIYTGVMGGRLTTYKGKLDGKDGQDLLLLGVIIGESPLDIAPIGIIADDAWLKRIFCETRNGEWRHAG